MGSTTALWFHIETVFAEVEELCIEARAAELSAHRRREEDRMLRAFGQGRTQAEPQQAPPPNEARYARAVELANDLAFREAHPNGADLVDLRARLRKRLTWLKSKLSEGLNDHEVYYTLFPIVVHCDELVRTVTRGATARWEPLQSELYETDNGGELFYAIIDDRLRQEETPPIVFEVFYFCLNDGFQGMYQGDPGKIAEYKARLAERIPKKPVHELGEERKDAPPVELVQFPWRYYVGAAAAVILGFVLLKWIGSTF